MKTLICCKNCGNTFSGESSWRGAFVTCPYCSQATYFSFDDKYRKSNDNPIWMILGGIGLAFILLICIIGFRIWAGTKDYTNSSSTYVSSPNSSLSIKGEIAKDYIENELSSFQRNALMGGGTFGERVNAISNLIETDNLSGAIEYLESYGE
ncbi:MAG: hypothetical protein GX946_02190 [Oligosphaeraceae bacterium]|nr:hypothetical protein [Oligosphaeraceae bacterium]